MCGPGRLSVHQLELPRPGPSRPERRHLANSLSPNRRSVVMPLSTTASTIVRLPALRGGNGLGAGASADLFNCRDGLGTKQPGGACRNSRASKRSSACTRSLVSSLAHHVARGRERDAAPVGGRRCLPYACLFCVSVRCFSSRSYASRSARSDSSIPSVEGTSSASEPGMGTASSMCANSHSEGTPCALAFITAMRNSGAGGCVLRYAVAGRQA